ncbi:hypothetical protein THERMOT_1215 [Bathymodiolus thermophilus thioautotrophic gill symbiont]|nr:hypothetical protein THERMOT_1215 [Bathymodiolus thermophilus thioautotrophic gill symbiont]
MMIVYAKVFFYSSTKLLISLTPFFKKQNEQYNTYNHPNISSKKLY